MEEHKSLKTKESEPDKATPNPKPDEVQIDLSDQTEVRGKKWENLKEHALTSTFHHRGWFVS